MDSHSSNSRTPEIAELGNRPQPFYKREKVAAKRDFSFVRMLMYSTYAADYNSFVMICIDLISRAYSLLKHPKISQKLAKTPEKHH